MDFMTHVEETHKFLTTVKAFNILLVMEVSNWQKVVNIGCYKTSWYNTGRPNFHFCFKNIVTKLVSQSSCSSS